MVIQLSRPKNNLKKKIVAILLCAGEGKRLEEITKDTPKPLIKIKSLNNVSILEHSIKNLFDLGIEQMAIVKGHLGAKIDEFTDQLKKKQSNLKDKLIIVDSGTRYKLGPLFSFLSITKDKRIINDSFIYMVLPGDTIFQFNLLNQIFNYIQTNFNKIQNIPVIFYREIKVNILRMHQESKMISIVDIEKSKSKVFLKSIQQIRLENLQDSNTIKQIIPLFTFSYKDIEVILKIVEKVSANTIKDIINYFTDKKEKIFAEKINKENKFYDIDSKNDLNKFEELNKL